MGFFLFTILVNKSNLKDSKDHKTYDAWPLKQRNDSTGWILLLPPTSGCQVHTVPSSAALANLCPHGPNRTADIDVKAYGG